MSGGYESRVEHYFIAGGMRWRAKLEEDAVFIEETTKNGQEDCHVAGYVFNVDGRLLVSDGLRKKMGDYLWSNTADEVQEFFDAHGAPLS